MMTAVASHTGMLRTPGGQSMVRSWRNLQRLVSTRFSSLQARKSREEPRAATWKDFCELHAHGLAPSRRKMRVVSTPKDTSRTKGGWSNKGGREVYDACARQRAQVAARPYTCTAVGLRTISYSQTIFIAQQQSGLSYHQRRRAHPRCSHEEINVEVHTSNVTSIHISNILGI